MSVKVTKPTAVAVLTALAAVVALAFAVPQGAGNGIPGTGGPGGGVLEDGAARPAGLINWPAPEAPAWPFPPGRGWRARV